VAGRAPYFSRALIVLVGLYTGYHGWTGLQAQHQAPAAQSTPATQPKAG
jgi:nickel/cobalt exporter